MPRAKLPTGHPTDYLGRIVEPAKPPKSRLDLLIEQRPHLAPNRGNLTVLLDKNCKHCSHPWLAHYDTGLGVGHSCRYMRDNKPACTCSGFTTDDIAAQIAHAAMQPAEPLVAEAARAESEKRRPA